MFPKKLKQLNKPPRRLHQSASLQCPSFPQDCCEAELIKIPPLRIDGRQCPTLSAVIFVIASCLVSVADAQSVNAEQIQKSCVQVFCFASPPKAGLRRDQLNPLAHGYGVLIANGTVLTNRHLLVHPNTHHFFVADVEPAPADKVIQLIPAKPKVMDAWSDLALLAAEIPNRKPIEFANPPGIQMGQKLTIHPASKELQSVTSIAQPFPLPVITDANTRSDALAFDSLYQHGGLTRFATNLGGFKSGAGVFNEQCQLVGITTALVPDSVNDPDAVAISLDQQLVGVIRVMQSGQLPGYGFMGVTPRNLSQQQRDRVATGVQVVDVMMNSPADFAGLQFSDVITHIDGNLISNSHDYYRNVAGRLAGTSVSVRIVRDALKEGTVTGKLEVQIPLSKCFLETRRQSWSGTPPGRWRGMIVDYPFAVSRLQLLTPSIDPAGCVLATDIEIGSAVWNAGLRPRTVITGIAGQNVRSPAEFYRLANQAEATAVELTIVNDETGQSARVSVPPR